MASRETREATYPDDDRFVARLRAADSTAFAELIARHGERIAALVRRLLDWRGDIEDVLQDVFVSVWTNLPRFRGGSRVSTWLFRIAINECRRHRRHRVRWLRFWQRQRQSLPGVHGHPATPAVTQHETCERVRAAVRRLPQRYREVVVLRHLEGLPIADIAQILNLEPNGVEVRLTRARARLKESLAGLLED